MRVFFYLLALTLASFTCFAQESTIYKPLINFKHRPFSLINFDPTIQFQTDVFLNKTNGLSLSYGFGSNRIFKESQNQSTRQYRLEYKKYIKPINNERNWASYIGSEFVYKHVLQNEIAIAINQIGQSSPDIDEYIINVNVYSFHLKYGKTFLVKGMPVLDAFLGLGYGYRFNFDQGLKPGYEFSTPTTYNRLSGRGGCISGTLGCNVGFAIWQKSTDK